MCPKSDDWKEGIYLRRLRKQRKELMERGKERLNADASR